MSDEEKKVVRLTPEQIEKLGLEVAISGDDLTEAELEAIAGGMADGPPIKQEPRGCACVCYPQGSRLPTAMMVYSWKTDA